jgi:hypothetical protein
MMWLSLVKYNVNVKVTVVKGNYKMQLVDFW